jgi:hypothetical protein
VKHQTLWMEEGFWPKVHKTPDNLDGRGILTKGTLNTIQFEWEGYLCQGYVKQQTLLTRGGLLPGVCKTPDTLNGTGIVARGTYTPDTLDGRRISVRGT